MSEPSVFLIGPRASGKSTLGRLLAAGLEWSFVDADEVLEQRAGRFIAEWLPAEPASFRAAESRLLQELLPIPDQVVALGGGVVEDPDNCAALAAHPRVVALVAEPETLVRRQRDGHRPPLTGASLEEEVRVVLARRRAAYERASGGRWIDTGGSLEKAHTKLAALIARMRTEVC